MLQIYGALIVLGILIGGFTAEKIGRKHNLLPKNISFLDILPWILIPGLIGARAYHVLDFFSYYKTSPATIFFIWQGGLGIFGAVAGGALGLFLYAKVKKLTKKDFLALLDTASLGLSLGQAIGRWGNFFNQELYGLPTSLPWAIYINKQNRLSELKDFSFFHPLFLYESIASFLIFLSLFYMIKKKKQTKKGTTFLFYLFLYSLIRFFLEFLRPRSWMILNFRVNQAVSLLLIIFASLVILKKQVKK
jgi:phosphatidylglycerol---prolipoprotein diacylglyceryl transferase